MLLKHTESYTDENVKMSLRHLYKDLDILGIYPDLIDRERSGGYNREVCFCGNYIITLYNKYYGYGIYHWGDKDGDTYSRKMYLNDNDSVFIYIHRGFTRLHMTLHHGKEIYNMIFDWNEYSITHGNEKIERVPKEGIYVCIYILPQVILTKSIKNIHDLNKVIEDVLFK